MFGKGITIKVKKNKSAVLPIRATEDSVGFDLIGTSLKKIFNGKHEVEITPERINRIFLLNPNERALVGTGLFIEIPKGYEGQIRPTSGNTLKKGFITHLGTIDSDYRGEVGIIIQNTSNFRIYIELGTKLAQMVIQKSLDVKFEWTDEDLSNTNRGEGGFGSTEKPKEDEKK